MSDKEKQTYVVVREKAFRGKRTGETLELSAEEAATLVNIVAPASAQGKAAVAAASADEKLAAIRKAYRTPLPEDFPMRETLIEAGLTTVGAVAGSESLGDLDGIGPKTLDAIQAAVAEAI